MKTDTVELRREGQWPVKGTAEIQGRLWGARTRDFAALGEGAARPLYERVLAEAKVGAGTKLLDVGCGPGLAAHIAFERGAEVAGLDAAEASLKIAHERTPPGDFRLGEMENLPWHDNTFDVVTGFSSFQYAADVVNTLREARRVAKSGGRVAMAVFSRPEDTDVVAIIGALSTFLPPPPPSAPGPFALSVPGRLEELLRDAGLAPLRSGEVDCPFEFPDKETAVRANMASGPAAAAIERAGEEAVRRAFTQVLEPFRTAEGGYRLRNRYRYLIAEA